MQLPKLQFWNIYYIVKIIVNMSVLKRFAKVTLSFTSSVYTHTQYILTKHLNFQNRIWRFSNNKFYNLIFSKIPTLMQVQCNLRRLSNLPHLSELSHVCLEFAQIHVDVNWNNIAQLIVVFVIFITVKCESNWVFRY